MSEATPKILEVGDVVFIDSTYRGLERIKINRVTAKKADVGGTLIDNTEPKTSWYVRGHGYSGTTYYLSTPELESKYNKSQLVRFITSLKTAQYEQMTTEQLQSIYQIIKGATK